MSTKNIKGKTLSGEDRTYTFNLISAKEGTRIFHEFVSVIIQLLPEGFDLESLKEGADFKIDIKQIVADLEEILPFSKLEDLVSTMLGNAKVKIGDKILEVDEDGFGEYAQGDPLETYTALLYAFKANFPKYIDPLF